MKLVTIAGIISVFIIIAGETASIRSETRAKIDPVKVPQYRKSSIVKFAKNPMEKSIHNQVNQYRQSQNLPPLTFDPTISAQARAHSQAMANISRLSHDGFQTRATALQQTIPYRAVAENVAYNMGHSRPDTTAVNGWVKSPGHQKNMVGEYDLTGIGVAQNSQGEYYFTQIFIRKR